jgi:hypothetical protein
MKVSGYLNAPAVLSQGKEPPVSIGYVGWAPEPVLTLEKRKKTFV